MIPEQEEGIQKDLHHSIVMESIDDAEDMFVIVKERLFDVNNWDKISASASGIFTIIDHNGHEVHRNAHKGDYIKIKMPAPSTSAGDGYDWVVIESIVYDDYPDEASELIKMTLRPSISPLDKDKQDIAHFFSDHATSTFIIERAAKRITVSYHGRNELPNTSSEHIIDKARNIMVAVGAMLGLSDVQWDSLLKGFLADDD